MAPRRDVFPRISDARARTVTSDAHPVHASARSAHSFHLARMDSNATKSPGPARRRGIGYVRAGQREEEGGVPGIATLGGALGISRTDVDARVGAPEHHARALARVIREG